MSKDFSKILEDAEKQVAGIKNEKLKEIAFSKLISHLLDGNSTDENDDDNSSTKKSKPKSTKRVASKASKGKTDGPKAWIEELVDENFFSKPKSSSDIRTELESRSHHLSATDITNPLQTICHAKKLRRKKETGGKIHWVNW
ncbi:MAG: hypothetical protein ABI851_16530 [Saprospiraceae bacterium]